MASKEKLKFFKRKRIFKTLIWRFVSTVTTFSVAYLVTGNLKDGGLIALVEGVIKMLLYFHHERMWDKYTKKTLKKIKSRKIK